MNASAPNLERRRRRPALRRTTRPFEHSERHRQPISRTDLWAFGLITLASLCSRFIGLGYPTDQGTPVFDEKHYVPQSWDIVHSWNNLVLGGIESNPGFGLVVHPPLAKQLMALAESVFGYSPWGWRFMSAAFGTGVVVLIMLLARELSQSPKACAFAGIIATLDGVLLVSSRFGMLDIFQVFFVIAAAWMLARDHRDMRQRIHSAFLALDGAWASPFGPRFGVRWWRFGAGIMLGCALAVKWSGLYYIAFFGLFCVIGDLYIRRRYGVSRPIVGTAVRDILPALASLVLVAILIYIWSWRAWFASETAVYRHAATDGTIDEDSVLNLFPNTLASWLYYHQSVLEFHGSLTTSSGHVHPWDSKPWAWLAGVRPILYYSNTDIECAINFGSESGEAGCRQMLLLFGTPAIWWLIVPALLWAMWCLIIRRQLAFALPLVGFAAGFVPWLIAYDRQMYFFYATALIPFVIVIYALILRQLAYRGRPVRWRWVRKLAGGDITWGTVAVIAYLATVLGMFLYWLPIFYGLTIPDRWYSSIMWLPSWR